jgi:hypothetical protein
MAATAGDERDWEGALAEIAAGLAASTALCKHGDHKIHKTPRGTWEDEGGLAVCAKAPLDQIGHGRVTDYVFHEPRPVIA